MFVYVFWRRRDVGGSKKYVYLCDEKLGDEELAD